MKKKPFERLRKALTEMVIIEARLSERDRIINLIQGEMDALQQRAKTEGACHRYEGAIGAMTRCIDIINS